MQSIHLTTFIGFICLVAPASAQAPSVAQPGSVFLEELTWMEARDGIAGGKTTVMSRPAVRAERSSHGAREANDLVKYKAGEVAKRLGNALVAPVVA